MMLQEVPVCTFNKAITVNGKVFYNDQRRRIDLKKPIRDLILDDSALDIFYTMEVCLSEEKALNRVKELVKNNIMPIILHFNKK